MSSSAVHAFQFSMGCSSGSLWASLASRKETQPGEQGSDDDGTGSTLSHGR